ncbi:unnamed protein product [Schistosoma turkestanicum]|nr:unnamed protein product [Schistosoma turkestanicum]
MFEFPYRSTQGGKAVRRLTAPSFLNNDENTYITNKNLLSCHFDSSTTSQPNLNGRLSRSDISSINDRISRKVSQDGLHKLRDRSLPGAISKEEVHSIYSLHQLRKNSYIRVQDPMNNGNRSPSRQTRRQEIIRCWSRERITRSETILNIRPPESKQNENKVESNNSCESGLTTSKSTLNVLPIPSIINKSESISSLPTTIRHIPIQLIDNDPVSIKPIAYSALKLIPISNQFFGIKKEISNKTKNLSFSPIEYSDYIDK